MRRLVVELYGPELAKRVEGSVGFGRLRSFELLHLLRYDRSEFAAICRIAAKNPSEKPESYFQNDPITTEIQVLSRDGDTAVVLLRRKPRGRRRGVAGRILFGEEVTKPGAGYLLNPMRYREGRLMFTFVGNQRQLREILAQARQRKLRYRVLSVADASFSGSWIDRLTERQRVVLRAAYDYGYYDVPRRIRSAQLAKTVGIRAATLVEHLRKAEKRLMDSIMVEP